MVIRPDQTVVGLIGTGVMGKSMAGHFIQAGYQGTYIYADEIQGARVIGAGGSVAGFTGLISTAV